MVKLPSSVDRFILPLFLFLLFFYFFGLSSLKKGSEKDVVVVGQQYPSKYQNVRIYIRISRLYVTKFTQNHHQ